MGTLSHLDELEAEAIYIMREVAAECEKPVMLYSIGKDSSVMLHLAMKAFYPEKPPFPFMHIDTTWKFKEMIEFRDKIAKEKGIDMIVYTNEEGVKQGINPFDHGSAYTDIMGNVFVLNMVLGVAFTIIVMLFLDPILYFFGGSDQTHTCHVLQGLSAGIHRACKEIRREIHTLT